MRRWAANMVRSRLNQNMVIGLSLLCLSALSLKALINALPAFDAWPPYQPLPSPKSWRATSDPRTVSNKAIQSTLKTISGLVADLNTTLSKTCPECIWRVGEDICVKASYDDNDIAILTLAGMFVGMVGAGGTLVFLIGVNDITPAFTMRVMIFGLGGINLAVAAVAFGFDASPWYLCALHVLCTIIVSLIVGVFFTGEEQVKAWRKERKVEMERRKGNRPETHEGIRK